MSAVENWQTIFPVPSGIVSCGGGGVASVLPEGEKDDDGRRGREEGECGGGGERNTPPVCGGPVAVVGRSASSPRESTFGPLRLNESPRLTSAPVFVVKLRTRYKSSAAASSSVFDANFFAGRPPAPAPAPPLETGVGRRVATLRDLTRFADGFGTAEDDVETDRADPDDAPLVGLGATLPCFIIFWLWRPRMR